MDSTQNFSGDLAGRQGGRPVNLTDLRSRLADPSNLQDGHQQRLLEVAQRLARVRSRGNEYARLELSEYVAAAMDRGAVAV